MSGALLKPMRRVRAALLGGVLSATLLPAAAHAAGDLIIAMQASIEPANLDYQVDPYTSTTLLNSFLTDFLVSVDPDGKFVPSLATEWTSTPDGKEWTFKLRPGITFQDGTPFDAEAVKYNFQRIKDPATASAELGTNVGPVKAIEVIDPLTVKFVYDVPWVTFLDVARRAPMWSPTAAKAATPQTFDKKLVGTGPFTFVEWVKNDHITFKRWDGFKGASALATKKGPVSLDTLTVKFIGEPAVLGQVVAAGEAHVAYQVAPLYLQDYKGRKDASILVKGQPGTGLSMVMNIRKPPLDNKAVRQALLYGRDMKTVNDLLFDGLYEASDGPLNNIHRCFWPGATTAYPHDVAKAKALLDGSGWKDDGSGVRKAKGVAGVTDGTPLKIRWTVLHHEQIGEALQAQYKQIGVDLVVEKVPGPVQLQRTQSRDFDVVYERLRSEDPAILDDIWNSKYDRPGGWAWTGYKSDKLDAAAASIRTLSGDKERCAAAHEVQKIVMDEALMLPTLSDPSFVIVSSKVKDFKMGASGTWFFVYDTTLSK